MVAKGVSRIGAAIKAAGEAETRQVVVSRNIELSSAGMPRCLVVARGWFHPKRPEAGAAYARSEDTAFDYDADPSFIRGQGLWLAATPDFYFEGRFKPSHNEAALALQPVYVYRGEPIATHTLRRSTARGTVLSFAISKPSKAKDLGKGQGATVVLGLEERDSTLLTDWTINLNGQINALDLGIRRMDALLDERTAHGFFVSLGNLLERVPQLHENEVENLVRCGACDGFELTRPELLWRHALIRKEKQGGARRRKGVDTTAVTVQTATLFPVGGSAPGGGSAVSLVPAIPDYSPQEKLQQEMEVLHLTATGHPMAALRPLGLTAMKRPSDTRALSGRSRAS